MMMKRSKMSGILRGLTVWMLSMAVLVQMTGCGNGGGRTVEPVRTSDAGLSVEDGVMINLSDYVKAAQAAPVVSDGSGKEEDGGGGGISEGLEGSADADKAIAAISDSSMRLFYENMKRDPSQNVLISPTSIQFAFGMTENGADGATLSEMEQIINGGLSIDEWNRGMYALNQRLSSAEEVDWNVADSIWVKNDGSVTLKEPFVLDAVSYYDADIVMAPFDDSTVVDINAWVNENTNGMIPSLLSTISPYTRMYLMNAMAFEGEWKEEYEEYQIRENREFTNADGTTSYVTMLSSEEYGYFYLGDGIGFRKNYKGGEYSFVGILPPENQMVEEYVAELLENQESFASAVKELRHDVPVYVEIPEFTLDYDVEMADMLIGMGLEKAFSDEDDADFTRMVTEDSAPIHIGAVIHKTHIEVDRKGTRAAAITAITMDTTCSVMEVQEPVYIYLNRPFVYAIIDNETGLPIFIGCMNELEGSF